MAKPHESLDTTHADPTLHRLSVVLNCLTLPIFMGFSLLAMPIVGNVVVAKAADFLNCRPVANDLGACSLFGWHIAGFVSSYEAAFPNLGLKNPLLALKAFGAFLGLPIGEAWTIIVLGLLIWVSTASAGHRRRHRR